MAQQELPADVPALERSPSSREDTMLELRPTCEHCNKALPPDALEARLCSSALCHMYTLFAKEVL